MKKRVITSILLIAFSSVILTSCGSSSGTKVENTKIETVETVKEKSPEDTKKEFIDSIKQLRDGDLKTIVNNCKDVDYKENPNFYKNRPIVEEDVQRTVKLKESIDKIKSIDGDEDSKKLVASLKSTIELIPEFNQMRLDFNTAVAEKKTDNKRIQVVGKRFQVNNAVEGFDKMLDEYINN